MTCEVLKRIAREALSCVDGATRVAEALEADKTEQVSVIAIGKAAAAMMRGALSALDGRLLSGLLITKHGHVDQALRQDDRISCLESDHPLPGLASLAAGRYLIEFIDALPLDRHCLFLISGGASSLVELLPDGVTLQTLTALNECLLASGQDIHRINAVRKRLSLIKGGGLLQWLKQRPARCLLISDVPGDVLADIGSGLLWAGDDVPDSVDLLQACRNRLPALELTARRKQHARVIEHSVIACNSDLLARVEALCREQGLTVRGIESPIASPEAGELAAQFYQRMHQGGPGLYLWGGETVCTLPKSPGQGGRNQHLALSFAARLPGQGPEQEQGQAPMALLALGTDGSDGPGTGDSVAAGACVDAGTRRRGEKAGLSIEQALRQADSGRFLQASGDLLVTGPTGTNVMDLVMGIKC